MSSLADFVLPAATALLSASGAWILGLGLRKNREGPDLSERVHRHRHRLTFWILLVTVGATTLPSIGDPASGALFREGPPSTPLHVVFVLLCVFAALAGDFPTRRAVFGESWTLGEFLGRALRGMVAFFGFWIVLLLAPTLVGVPGPWNWAAAAGLFGLLLMWSRHFPAVLERLLRTTPVEDPDLRREFQVILDRSSAPAPRVLQYGTERGGWSNAFALPATRTPRVLLSRPLLATLNEDEICAVFAHEVAHLEDFSGDTLRRMRWVEVALIGTGCFLQPALVALLGGPTSWIFWGWAILLLFALVSRARGMQERETKADLRAVDLCGDAEAVVRGLTAVHVSNRVPRRMAADEERIGTHPSLARRIADVRAYALRQAGLEAGKEDGVPADAAPAPVHTHPSPATAGVHVSRKDRTAVLVLDDRAVRWLTLPNSVPPTHEGGPAALRSEAVAERSVAYSGLVELRIVARGGGPELRAVEPDGKRHSFPLRQEDVGTVQSTLDRVDAQLAPASTARGGRAHPGVALLCFLAAFCSFLAFGHGVVGVGACLWVLLTCVPAMARRSRTWVSAVGALALVVCLTPLVSTGDQSGWSRGTWLLLVAGAAAGALCLWRVRSRTADTVRLPDGKPKRALAFFLLLGLPILGVQLWWLRDGNALLKLYGLGLNSAGSFLPLIGAATALWLLGRRWVRVGALMLALAGLSHLWLGSEHFLTHVARDPLAVRAPALPITEGVARRLAETSLDRMPAQLELAPDGSRYLIAEFEESEDAAVGVTTTYRFGAFGSSGRTLRARQLTFAGVGRLLALVHAGTGAELQARPWTEPDRVDWKRSLPSVGPESHVELVAAGDRWRLVVDRYGGTTRRLRGRIGSGEIESRHWTDSKVGGPDRRFGPGETALELRFAGPRRGSPGSGARVAWVLCCYDRSRTLDLWTRDRRRRLATTALWAECGEPPPGASLGLCLARGVGGVRGFGVDFATGGLKPLFQTGHLRTWAWDGRRFTAYAPGEILRLDTMLGRGIRLRLANEMSGHVLLAAAERHVAIAHPRAGNQGARLVLLDAAIAPRSAKR